MTKEDQLISSVWDWPTFAYDHAHGEMKMEVHVEEKNRDRITQIKLEI